MRRSVRVGQLGDFISIVILFFCNLDYLNFGFEYVRLN